MKNQYFGDVNDFKKYGLLRHLASGGEGELAVCWSRTVDDTRSDGSRIHYLEDPAHWRELDPVVFDFVHDQVLEKRIRDVDALASSNLLPRSRFFGDVLEDELANRDAYFNRFFRFARGAKLVFFDPDNGLGITAVQRGERRSSKYVYPCEVERAWSAGHSVLFYQHFPRRPRDAFLGRLVSTLATLTGLKSVVFFVTSHVVFVLLPRPDHEAWLLPSAGGFAAHWSRVVSVQLRAVPGAVLRPFSRKVREARWMHPSKPNGDPRRSHLPAARWDGISSS